MSQDEIKTTGSCCSKTVNDLVSGRTNGIFVYFLLRKTTVNDLLRKAYTTFIFLL